MYSKEGRLKASGIFLASSASALLACAALFAGATTFVSTLSQGPRVELPVSSWHWFSEVKLGFERAEAPAPAPLAVIPPVVTAPVHVVRHVAMNTHHRKAVRYAHLARVFKKTHPVHLAENVEELPITVRSAHPVTAPVVSKAAQAPSPAPTEDVQASPEELQKMRGIQVLLKSGFIAALRAPLPAAAPMLAAREVPPDEMNSWKPRRPHLTHLTHLAHTHHRHAIRPVLAAVVVKHAPAVELQPLTVPIAKFDNWKDLARTGVPSAATGSVAATGSAQVAQVAPAVLDTLTTHQAAAVSEPKAQQEPPVQARAPDPESARAGPAQGSEPKETPPPIQVNPVNVPTAPASTQEAWVASASAPEAAAQPTFGYPIAANQVNTHAGAERGGSHALPPAPTMFASIPVGTQPRASTPHVNSPPPVIPTTVPDDSFPLHEGILAFDGAQAPEQQPPFVEAFDLPAVVNPTTNQNVTVEGANGRGWKEAQASGHWPTVYWYSDPAIPLVAENSAQLLARKAGSPLAPSAGIVIARVPSGWTAEFSGRAERPFIFDSRNQLVADGETEGERYFAFINAAPGAQLLYVTSSAGAEQDGGAIALPVFSGRTTYVDATVMSHRRLTGIVLDAEHNPTIGMAKVDVHVVGQSRTAVTAADGTFEIDGVGVFSDHAVFVETEARDGFTHRYKVKPDEMNDARLFRLSQSQIQDSIGQLEGGVSPDSGLVMGALNSLLAKNAGGALTVSVRSLAPEPTLVPEVYTIAPSGQLSVTHELQGEISRFLSLQIPEGPLIVEARDSSAAHSVVWSELLVASPGVVDLIMDPN